MVNKDLPIPLYHQVRSDILSRIQTGELRPSERLAAEGELAAAYGVSKITIKQALRDLSLAGYVRREQGRGTFVSLPDVSQGPRELTGFTEEMRRYGYRASSKVLSKKTIQAGENLAAKLRLAPGEAVLCLRRLRLADGDQMGLQTAYLALRLAPGLGAENFQAHSLYDLLRARYGVVPSRARETHFAMSADAESAALLGIPEGSPVMAAERVTFLADGTPLEFVESVMRGDRYRIVLDLTTGSGQTNSNSQPLERRHGGTHEDSSISHGRRNGPGIGLIARSKRLK